MFHWDVASGTKYKSPVAYILQGGYDNFTLSYPMCVINPWSKSRPTTASKKSIDIEAVEYPDLDAAFIASPSPQASPAVASGAITVSNTEMEASPSR